MVHMPSPAMLAVVIALPVVTIAIILFRRPIGRWLEKYTR
jgi:hypothetical protein